MSLLVASNACQRELQAVPASVGVARDWAHARLCALGLKKELVQSGMLIMSELVTNAVEISKPTDTVLAYVGLEGDYVNIAAADQYGDRLPTERPTISTLAEVDGAALEAEFGGWGLPLVKALAARFWVQPYYPHGRGGPKWVCASLWIGGGSMR